MPRIASCGSHGLAVCTLTSAFGLKLIYSLPIFGFGWKFGGLDGFWQIVFGCGGACAPHKEHLKSWQGPGFSPAFSFPYEFPQRAKGKAKIQQCDTGPRVHSAAFFLLGGCSQPRPGLNALRSALLAAKRLHHRMSCANARAARRKSFTLLFFFGLSELFSRFRFPFALTRRPRLSTLLLRRRSSRGKKGSPQCIVSSEWFCAPSVCSQSQFPRAGKLPNRPSNRFAWKPERFWRFIYRPVFIPPRKIPWMLCRRAPSCTSRF